MKNNSVLSNYLKYVSLNILAMTGLSCYILADTFFVSKGMGSDGLAALNLAIPVYSFINGTGLMLGIGGATKYAVYKAQRNNNGANTIFTNTIALGVIFSVLFLLAGLFFSCELSIFLGGDSATLAMTNTYLKTIMIFSPMFILNNILTAFVRNDNAPRLSMSAMLIGSASNIFLDYIFIFPCQMGMFGAAFATGLAPVISILSMAGYFVKKRNGFYITPSKISLANTKTIAFLGSSSFITEVSSGIVIIIFNIVILDLSGNLGVAAYGIIANLALVATAIFTGIAQGIQPIISGCCGIGAQKDIQKTLHLAVITSLAFAAVIYCAALLFSPHIISAFNSGKSQMLAEIAENGMRIYFAGFFFSGLNIIIASALAAAEKPLYSFTISISRGFAAIIPLLLILSYALGINGVWLSYPVAEALACIGALYLSFSFKQKKGF